MIGWRMPVTTMATTAANATWGLPIVKKTIIQRATVWKIKETKVAVKGVE
jgi:hypothetical protein